MIDCRSPFEILGEAQKKLPKMAWEDENCRSPFEIHQIQISSPHAVMSKNCRSPFEIRKYCQHCTRSSVSSDCRSPFEIPVEFGKRKDFVDEQLPFSF